MKGKNVDKLNETIEKWFSEQFNREPISTNTQHWNYVRAAVDDLKNRLKSSPEG